MSVINFDDCEGVTFVLVHNKMDEKLLEAGLSEWRRRHPIQEAEEPIDNDASEEYAA